jgi:hypothetical protein
MADKCQAVAQTKAMEESDAAADEEAGKALKNKAIDGPGNQIGPNKKSKKNK